MTKKISIDVVLLFVATLFLFFVSNADDQNTVVTYHVDSSYTWEIHTDISFGKNAGTGQTVNTQAKLSDNTLAGVRVNENIIPNNSELRIRIDPNQQFKISSGNTSLNYSISKTDNGTALKSNGLILSVPSGTNTGSQQLYFKLNTGSNESEIAGTYTGTISYVANIEIPQVYVYFYDDNRELIKEEHYPKGTQLSLPFNLTGLSSLNSNLSHSIEYHTFEVYSGDSLLTTISTPIYDIFETTFAPEQYEINNEYYYPGSTITLNTHTSIYLYQDNGESTDTIRGRLMTLDISDLSDSYLGIPVISIEDEFGHSYVYDYDNYDNMYYIKNSDNFYVPADFNSIPRSHELVCSEIFNSDILTITSAPMLVDVNYTWEDYPALNSSIEVPVGTDVYIDETPPTGYINGQIKNNKLYYNPFANESNKFTYYVERWAEPLSDNMFEYYPKAYTGQSGVSQGNLRETYVYGSCALGIHATNPYERESLSGKSNRWDYPYSSPIEITSSDYFNNLSIDLEIYKDNYDEYAYRHIYCNEDYSYIGYFSHTDIEYIDIKKNAPANAITFNNYESTCEFNQSMSQTDLEEFNEPTTDYFTDYYSYSIVSAVNSSNQSYIDSFDVSSEDPKLYIVTDTLPADTYRITIRVTYPESNSYYATYKDMVYTLHVVDKLAGIGEITNNKVIIYSGVTSIPAETLKDSSEMFRELEFRSPSSVLSIGSEAFAQYTGMSSLSSIDIPDSVLTIGNKAFKGSIDEYGATISIGSSVTSIGSEAFSPAPNSSIWGEVSITFKGNPTSMQNAFANLSNVKVISNTLTDIDSYMFTGVSSLVLPSSIRNIKSYAFKDASFQEFGVPTGTTTIGSHAFDGVSAEDVYLPDTLTSIDSSAFANSYIDTIHYNGNLSGFPWGATNGVQLAYD